MPTGAHADKILILDFGSQYTQLIARRIRELNVYSEIHPFNYGIDRVREFVAKGIILSGSPSIVGADNSPRMDAELLGLGVPVLGICYGMQLLAAVCGGTVETGPEGEYGKIKVDIDRSDPLFSGFVEGTIAVWMSHNDRVSVLPRGFKNIAWSAGSPIAAMSDASKRCYGVQFHPEVTHTPDGKKVISNFLFNICSCRPSWTMAAFVEGAVRKIRETSPDGNVICALSGGVDSSVAAALVHRAVGGRLTCIFVNNGLLRKGEGSEVQKLFGERFHFPLISVDAEARFLTRLRGVSDPEEKRKIVGREFIRVFEEEAAKLSGVRHLVQGTLYPDVIESVSERGPSAVIKSHHNVGGLPEEMELLLIEPLRELFKDEVRAVGRELGLPEELISRHPFPGPGLSVRIIGEVTKERLDVLREADYILIEEIRTAGWYSRIWQAFSVLLPVKTVGVMGDERTYENVVAIRAVQSQDGMTADWVQLPYDLMGRISNRIINEVEGINRVVYDISSKPPATIEWE